MKPVKNVIALVLVLAMAFSGMAASKASRIYDNAVDLMVEGKYAEAVELFDSIAGYEDATREAMYCKTILLAEEGDYEKALNSLEFLGDYKDCDYLYAYYAACQMEDKAASEPELYLEAAELFSTIELFRDSSERAQGCKQALYDLAWKIYTQEHNYSLAGDYFDMLGDFSDSRDRSRIAHYTLGLDYMEQREYLKAKREFIQLGSYVDCEQRAADAEMLSNFVVRFATTIIEPRMDDTILLMLKNNAVHRSDPVHDQCFGFCLVVENHSGDAFETVVGADIDGTEWVFKASTVKANGQRRYIFSEMDIPENFTAGKHNCTWYINDYPVLEAEYEVLPGRSFEKQTDLRLMRSLEVREGMTTRKDGRLSELKEENTVYMDQLEEGGMYTPVIRVTNPTDETITVQLNALLDGEHLQWAEAEILPDSFKNFNTTVDIVLGEHTFEYYLNSCYMGAYHFSIEENSPQIEEEVETDEPVEDAADDAGEEDEAAETASGG